jgi:hypothetical protein
VESTLQHRVGSAIAKARVAIHLILASSPAATSRRPRYRSMLTYHMSMPRQPNLRSSRLFGFPSVRLHSACHRCSAIDTKPLGGRMDWVSSRMARSIGAAVSLGQTRCSTLWTFTRPAKCRAGLLRCSLTPFGRRPDGLDRL